MHAIFEQNSVRLGRKALTRPLARENPRIRRFNPRVFALSAIRVSLPEVKERE